MTALKPVTLCADDFGLHAAIDGAIIHLAKLGHLQATSCMTDAPRWPQAARALLALQDQLPAGTFEIGLHFNLTEGYAAPPPFTLGRLMLQSWARTLSPNGIRQRLNQQLDAFEAALGRAPDYLDGHQHVHQFPVIRRVVLETLQARYGAAPKLWLRSTVPADATWGGKAALLAKLGGKALQDQLDARGLRHNTGFGGVYGFDAPNLATYDQLMRGWLAGAQAGTLLMCHPALSVIPNEAIATARALEYQYLQSEAFTQALQDCGVQLRNQAHLHID